MTPARPRAWLGPGKRTYVGSVWSVVSGCEQRARGRRRHLGLRRLLGTPGRPGQRLHPRYNRLPNFLGLFDVYAGPWWPRAADAFTLLVLAFLGVTLLAAWSGWLLWRGSKAGAVLNLALLPMEALFWFGFALPIPWLFGVARVALVMAAWRSLGVPREPATDAP